MLHQHKLFHHIIYKQFYIFRIEYKKLKNNYIIEKFDINEAIQKIKENMPKNEKNKVISPDMISAIEEYLHQLNG